VLNRLYIVVGIVAIVVLAAAFIVPNLVPWGNYRGRMEMLAGQALGADVKINGDIHFLLLPQPHLELKDVAVGDAGRPVISINSADADFSLMDFLRDRYTMTRLVLDHPVLDLQIEPDGSLNTGLNLASGDSKAVISVADAEISVGRINVSDAVSGRKYALEGINGELSIGALRGPFGFSGGGSIGEQHYGFHVTAGPFAADGSAQLSLFAQPDGNGFSVDANGTLATAGGPHFSGDLNYRRSPPADKNPNNVIGDLTLAGKLDATPARMALADFTLVPDENRAVTRLTGSATVDFGPTPSFAATLTGGALDMPPRDATTEQGPQPYELVRMLGELPAVPVPPIAGTVSVSADELGLRSFALQKVGLLASTDASKWSIKRFSGQLPGGSNVLLSGDLNAPDGRPNFSGTLSIATDRLDTLATLWRKPAPDNPLFNMPGSFQSKVSLLGQTMALTDGQLTLDGVTHSLTALVTFGAQRRIDLSGQFKDVSAEDSAALLALLPDLQQDASAPLTFPQGAVSLTANSATLFGLPGRGLALEGKWGDGAVEISKFAAADLGGADVDLSLALSGTMTAPRIAGDGDVKIGANGGPALDRLFDMLGTPRPVRTLLARSLPVDLKAHLDKPEDNGGQGLSLSGKAGAADATLVAQLRGGIGRVLSAPISATLDLRSADPRALTAQLGLGDVSLLSDSAPLKLSASIDGDPGATLKTTLDLAGGSDSIAFDGDVTPGDLSAMSGSGKLKVALSDSSVLAADAGIVGIDTPPLQGSADLKFTAGRSIALDNIAGQSKNTGFSGNLALNGDSRGAVASGALSIDSIDAAALAAAVGGPTSLITSAGQRWPDGPLAIGDTPRTTTGQIDIKTPAVTFGGRPLINDASFGFDWSATNVGVNGFAGKLGGGTVSFDVGLCCAGSVADKDVTGQASLKGVATAALLPPASAATVSGSVDGSVRFNGSGDSIAAVLSGLAGDGSFAVSDLKLQHFDPEAFAAIAAIDNIAELDPKDLTSKVSAALDQGPFGAPKVSGGLTIAGGTVRVSNVSAGTPAARLFGGVTLKLADLSLGGGFALTPVGTLDKAGLVSETTSRVTANLSGTLLAPKRSLDVASMVDAVKMKALEVEVARLEALKAQDDARAKASAQANKETAEDQAAQQLADQKAAAAAAATEARQAAADAAAKKAAADAAQKKADADAAAKKAAADETARQSPPVPATPPLELGLPQAPFF